MSISTFAFLYLIPSYTPTLSVNAQGEVFLSNTTLTNNQTTDTSGDNQDPPLGSDFVWKGIISSDTSILPGRESTQSAVILPPREDGAMYAGILTFQASRPVDAVSWNILDPANVTLSEDIGDRDDVIPVQGLDIALNELDTSSESGSIMFTGNVLELAGDDDPFVVTYNVKARADNASQINEVRSLVESADSEEEQED
ncbi:MAG: hypothetical protein GEU26_14330 [Nitrososphaeraceae archaeon]|nr:hypothetical protein [Nitrososphaeraceae archaeon]